MNSHNYRIIQIGKPGESAVVKCLQCGCMRLHPYGIKAGTYPGEPPCKAKEPTEDKE